MAHYPPSARPFQVSLCLQAAQNGDLDGVKEQVRQLLHTSVPSPANVGADPAWLFDSLSAAIERNDRKMVEFLLDENVMVGSLPAEGAVRAGAYGVLELFLDCGWDINLPDSDEPPVLGYDFRTCACPS